MDDAALFREEAMTVYAILCTKSPLSSDKGLFGAGNVTRTHDLLITNQLLYRLSYTSMHMWLFGCNLILDQLL